MITDAPRLYEHESTLEFQENQDGKILVIHDADVKRIIDRDGAVKDLTLGEIKSLFPEKSQKIRTLKEAFDFLDRKLRNSLS